MALIISGIYFTQKACINYVIIYVGGWPNKRVRHALAMFNKVANNVNQGDGFIGKGFCDLSYACPHNFWKLSTFEVK